MAENQEDQTPETPIRVTTDEVESVAPKPEGENATDNKAKVAEPKTNKLAKLWRGYLAKKKLTFPLTVLLLIIVIMAVPFSRYKVLGLMIKRPFAVIIIDTQTGKPISDADISLAGHTAKTDNQGKATITTKVGDAKLAVTKKYYAGNSRTVLVPLSKAANPLQIKLLATGRQVPIKILNKITGKPVENVTIAVGGTQSHTDKNGTVTIVLPADKSTLSAILSATGYNNASVTVQITDQQTTKNNFVIVPAGKLYFLSKATGKIDVVKTDLDGANRQTVIAGTGLEDDNDTLLLASRDWKYLALKSIRDSGPAKLYLIDTSTDKLTTMDEGDASFDLIGWHDDYFLYIVYRNNISSWQPGGSSIKSFNAQTGKLTTLDSTDATGTDNASAQYENFITANTQILGDQLVYSKTWYSYPGYINVPGKQNTLSSISPDGTNKKTISSLDSATAYFGTVTPYSPDELLVQVSQNDGGESFYEYDSSGNYTKSTSFTDNDLFKAYPTYLLSPSGNNTFWSESRDGKNSLFIGDQNGANGQEIASLSELTPYGWYSDDYLLATQNGSELYIMPRTGGTPLKVSDYHKPAQNFNGYGGGYGGF